MNVRPAEAADRPAIRDVARRSMQASYSLDVASIVTAIDEWYDENRLSDELRDDSRQLLVVELDGQVVAFSDCAIKGEGTGELLWLHVDPDYRGENVSERLYERTMDRLAQNGAEKLQGRVLADNVGGNTFYREKGLSKVGEEEVTIDGTSYVQNVYADVDEEAVDAVEVEGETVYVDHDNTETGSIAEFHVVYTERGGEQIYGYWCAECESLATAMDTMGRIQCDDCGNARKPSRWDAAYL